MLHELRNDTRVLWTEDVLRFGDTDAIGHINNSTFSVICESGRVNLFRAKIFPTLAEGSFIVIARLVIDFRSELHYPGRVQTATWLSKLGRTSVTIGQALFSDGRVAASAEAVCVVMDRISRRPVPLPEATRRAAQTVLRENPEAKA
jgi:acyl-CoA thioester hydrolase